ncbi:hypothetical protein BO83DRAFT_175082 [Aspergillus eucalypticola CBS 122712]|uniref:Uncharacterized protein n=1 Tax=Aspergillus eucalypticola (strain CBS 122712 / IBT 29274) TaxID=1448314 RepID=A0A317W4K0_ASPEC|nr:uncharacterized protein BO83DRAFT_175082 [Aspergillus eucalypticola CBS 122712]PWY81363.1 hypothetical protein BO83DRAFT_175082 [Aspergillus eucalypticola CBS 122712]
MGPWPSGYGKREPGVLFWARRRTQKRCAQFHGSVHTRNITAGRSMTAEKGVRGTWKRRRRELVVHSRGLDGWCLHVDIYYNLLVKSGHDSHSNTTTTTTTTDYSPHPIARAAVDKVWYVTMWHCPQQVSRRRLRVGPAVIHHYLFIIPLQLSHMPASTNWKGSLGKENRPGSQQVKSQGGRVVLLLVVPSPT